MMLSCIRGVFLNSFMSETSYQAIDPTLWITAKAFVSDLQSQTY